MTKSESAPTSRDRVPHLTPQADIVQLYFEDFLEALVRVAYQKALPSDADIEASGAAHAGEFLQRLSASPDEADEFKRRRSRCLHEPLDEPLHKRLGHLMDWLLYTVRGGDSLKSVTRLDANRFKEGKVKTVQLGGSAAGGLPQMNVSASTVDISASASKQPSGVEDERGDVVLMRRTESAPTLLSANSEFRSTRVRMISEEGDS